MKTNKITMITLVITIWLAIIGAAYAENAATMTRKAQAAITPDQALEMLKQGNARFVNRHPVTRDLAAQVGQTAAGQFPFAAVVSCLDSRIPPEMVFDQGIGDMFVARVAGNFVNDDILGSLEFATRLSGAKLIVIMGHTECGAIKGACDGAQLGLLTAALANINPAVAAVKDEFKPKSSKNSEFVQAVAEMNVRLTMQKLRERSVVLNEMLDNGEIAMVGAMYDVNTGQVIFYR